MQDEPVATESNVTESKVESQTLETPIVVNTPPQPPETPTPPQVEEPVATESKVEESKVESQTQAETPVATELKVTESLAETTPLATESNVTESKVESTLPVVDIPPTTPPVVATESKVEELKVEGQTEGIPAVHDPKYTKDVPQRVLELTAEEINAARLLWARENIGQAQKQANRNRNARMNKRMDVIEAFVKTNPQTSVRLISNAVQLSQKLTSSYLQRLVRAGRIHATGKTQNRRFY